MFTKIAFMTTTAAILLSTASATIAAPKNEQASEAMYSSEFTTALPRASQLTRFNSVERDHRKSISLFIRPRAPNPVQLLVNHINFRPELV